MEKRTKKIIEDAKNVRLTPEEKAAILARLKEHAGTGAVEPVPSPLRLRVFVYVRRYAASVVAALFLLTAIGTSVLAEGSLPGDTLYPLKVRVNEKVETFLAFGGEAEAEIKAEHALERLEEIEQLAGEGKLSAETEESAKAHFEASVAEMNRKLEKIEAKGNTEAVVRLRAKFESRLDETFRALVTAAAATGTTTTSVIDSVKVEIKSNAEGKIKSERKEIEVRGQTESRGAAEGTLTAAENKLKEVRAHIEEHGGASAEVSGKLEAADKLIAEGKIKLEAGSFGEAFVLFKRAHRTAQEAKLIFRTTEEIEKRNERRDGRGEQEEKTEGEVNTTVEIETQSGKGSGKVKNEVKVRIGL